MLHFDCFAGASPRSLLEALHELGAPRRRAVRVDARSREVLRRLARARVRLDARARAEVAAVCAAVAALGAARVTCSPLPLGRARGAAMFPSRATLALLRGVPTRPLDAEGETVTPPAAALLATLADEFGPLPALRPLAQGFGGDELRAVLGLADAAVARDRVAVLETHLDDMTPEHLAFLLERLHEDGALDAALAPLVMKKGRPGQLLRVLAKPADAERLARAVLAGSSALGVRLHEVPRLVLRRRTSSVRTPFGPIRVKVSHAPDGARRVKAEYEACARAARAHGVSIASVARAAERRAEDELA